MHEVRHSSWIRRLTMVAIGLLVGVLSTSAPAGAQDDPYGSTTTTHGPPAASASCKLSVTSGPVGARVTATVRNVPFGATVRILFGGEEVGRGTAPAGAQSVGRPVLFGGAALPAQSGTTTVAVPFTVPDVPEGRYTVSAVGADFTCFCSPESAGFEVLADGEHRALARDGGRGFFGGALPRTGVYVALLVVVAAVLLLVGRSFVEASRRRRRQVARAARHAAREAEAADELTGSGPR